MEIQEIAIDHYGPLRDVRHRPRPLAGLLWLTKRQDPVN